MTAAASLRAGQRAWRIAPGPDTCTASTMRCVIIRVLRSGRLETAPSLLSLVRLELPAADVFADQESARAEARRRREQGKLL